MTGRSFLGFWFVAAPLACLASPPPGVVQAAVESDRPLADRFRDLKQREEARVQAHLAEIAALRKTGALGGSDEIRRAIERQQAGWLSFRDEVAGLVRSHPEDPAAIDGILLIGADLDDDLAALVEGRFLDDARLGCLCSMLMHASRDSSRRLLERIASDGSDGPTRGRAAYAAGEWFLARAKAGASRATAADLDRAMLEARRHLERVVAEHPNLTSIDGSTRLADRARADLTWIANAPGLRVGRVATAIAGDCLDGGRVDLADHCGKIAVIVFWGTWCKPCMAMVPHERELAARMKGKPFVLIGVNADQPEDRAKAAETARNEGMDWPSIWDGGPGGSIQTRYNVDHCPTVYVLDARGIIRFIDVRGGDLDQAVDGLLGETDDRRGR